VRILVIGGTRFFGRHLTGLALEAGHEVTLFNRGRTGPDLFPRAERITGDRDGDLDRLAGRTWDAVVDTCGFVPRVVGASARALARCAGHYTFVSTLSVYADESTPGLDETAAPATIDDPGREDVNDRTYGALKALCERQVEAAFGDRALLLRAGVIVGPNDYRDRLAYWVRRVARGGEVLAPGPPTSPVQMIDARDMAAWNLRMIESGRGGAFNTVGPERPLTLESVLRTCREVTGSDATLQWVSPGFLRREGVEPWTEMPLWLPADEGVGVMTSDVRRAVAAGLRFRPLRETVRDVFEWDRDRPRDVPLLEGIEPEREAALLRAWHDRPDPD
jgi:2'-hydroxyisoflavone reductase